MGGAIGAIAQVVMPMVSNLLSGGLGGILGKLGNFGDMFKNLFSSSKDGADSTAAKMGDSQKQADKARDEAKQFVINLRPAPRPAFNLNIAA